METNNKEHHKNNGEDNKKSEGNSTEKTTATIEESNEEQEGKKMSWQIVLTVIAIIAIILVFALPSNKDEVVTFDEEGNEIVTEENNDAEGESMIQESTGKALSSMTPVSTGDDFVYTFKGIDWFLETVDGGTAVKFKFSEFSRREGSIVAFGNPYRLGVFDGQCQETSNLTYNTTVNPHTPLAFVTCRNEDGEGADIALFQDGAKVYGSQRNTIDGVTSEFSEFFSRDITTIVR